MNDRFKFRCYNKFQEKMFEVKSMSYIDGIVKRIEVQDEERILIFDEWQNNIDNTILMQCTGLKDKNGKLIYEGDIINCFDCRICSRSFPLVEKGIITYKKAQFIVNTKFSEYLFEDIEDIEIIGNMYENLELFEEVSE